MSLPENFKCVITNWDYIYRLCRKIAMDVRSSGYKPDVIVALARGGWFAGRVWSTLSNWPCAPAAFPFAAMSCAFSI